MIKAISIDDEPSALDVIDIHALKVASVKIVKRFTDPGVALNYMKENPVDLIFLDINMPVISGIELLEKVTYKPFVVFTTAYSQYAIDSYSYEAIDYLLKPIEFDRFYSAIKKVEKAVKLHSLQRDSLLSRFLFIKDGYKQVKFNIDEILYIQGEGNYLKIVSEKEKASTRLTFKEISNKLPCEMFVRIHNTFIVNLCHIEKIEDNHVFIGKIKIPVSGKYKDDLFQIIKL